MKGGALQSKNVLWLGLLFVLLLITFCITHYINQFHPNIQTVTTAQPEIIDETYEKEKEDIQLQMQQADDNAYMQVVKLVEQEEKDIQDAFNEALLQEQNRSQEPLHVKPAASAPVIHTVKKVVKKEKKPLVKPKRVVKSIKKPKKVIIESVVAVQILTANSSQKLPYYDRYKLKKLAQLLKRDRTLIVRIESDTNLKKIALIKRYLYSLGITSKRLEIQKNAGKTIEISVIKKDT